MTVRRRARDLAVRLVTRVRHAKHPFTGWRRAAVIAAQASTGLVGLFAAANLALSLSTFRGDDPLERMRHELVALWHSPPPGRPPGDRALARTWPELGGRPEAAEIRAHLEAQAADDEFLFDHVLADHIVRRWGRVDARTLPVGVYVGAHALGPDGLPFVPVTKYLAHYLLFPRHAYVLVVPETGPAVVFSASTGEKLGAGGGPDRLRAVLTPYAPGAYDFPGSGQALHELTRVASDGDDVDGMLRRLDAARRRLEASEITYGLLAPNSNTVVGCILQAAGEMSERRRSTMLLALRAPGFGADCDLD